MNVRMQRMRMIKNILNAQVIDSQEQLLAALRLQGIEVTQATLSRDLRDLRAEKKVMADGSSKYCVPTNPVVEKRVLGLNSNLVRMSVVSIDFCGPFAVVKTRPGYANAVAYDLDSRGSSLLLGTLAGDDTILLIPRETTTRDQILDFMQRV